MNTPFNTSSYRKDSLSQSGTSFSSLWKQHKIAILLFILSLIIAFPYTSSRFIERYPKANEVSQETVIAPFTYKINKSDTLLRREQSQAESAISPVFTWNNTAIEQTSQAFDTLLSQLRRLANNSLSDSIHLVTTASIDPVFTADEVKSMVAQIHTVATFRNVITQAMETGLLSHVPASNLQQIEKYRQVYDAPFKYILTDASKIAILTDTLEEIEPIATKTVIPQLYDALFQIIPPFTTDRAQLTSALFHIFEKLVHPSLQYNATETSQRRAEARNAVNVTLRVIPKNVEIVRKHQIVTPTIAENLEALQAQYDQKYASAVNIKGIITQVTTLILLFMLAYILIRNLADFIPHGVDSTTYFNALSLIVAVSFLIIRIGAALTISLTPETTTINSTLTYTAIPMVVGALLASALFNKETGFTVTIFFAVYGGILGGFDPIIPVGTLIAGGIVSSLAASMRYRRDFITMVLWITLTNILIGTTMILVSGEPQFSIFHSIILFAITNAATSVGFSFFILPLFEQFFHLTTDMTLMELADMNHPLLKEMAIKAPGTYNHSIMVANLAESAADAVGADALLCRVVSYYHDIGKLKKPVNFIENQYSKRNIHDRLSPSMSVSIIKGHVKEGLELAEEYKLPQAIKDVIPQHHGDAPIAFFYHKALEEKKDKDEINIRDYSYGGPKPQTRENAIVMIADSVEAASRTMKGTTLKDIREMVKKIIWGKISHGQLDESGLNLNDLSTMVNGMMPILEGVYHSRIEYPEEEEKQNGEV